MEDLQAQVAYQRAFEAVIWSAPAVAIYRLRVGAFSALGAEDNVILACSLPATPRIEALTANNVTPYIAAYTDLRKGPVVLEVPAVLAMRLRIQFFSTSAVSSFSLEPTIRRSSCPIMPGRCI